MLISFALKHISFWCSKTHVSGDLIRLDAELALGSDYRLYTKNTQITSKQVFLDVKNQALQIAPAKNFQEFFGGYAKWRFC